MSNLRQNGLSLYFGKRGVFVQNMEVVNFTKLTMIIECRINRDDGDITLKTARYSSNKSALYFGQSFWSKPVLTEIQS